MTPFRVPSIQTAPRLSSIGVIRLGTRNGTNPTEADHFILDIEDPALAERARAIYGSAPKRLSVSFHSSDLDDVFRFTLQRWASGKAAIPTLYCEGNGEAAYQQGRKRSCPCEYAGKSCTRKMVLKVLLPEVSLGGYFVLASKSSNNAANVHTALKLALAHEGRLAGVPMILARTPGYAEVNKIRTRKYFVSLIWDRTVESVAALPCPDRSAEKLPPPDDSAKLMEGRTKVRKKLAVLARRMDLDPCLDRFVVRRYGISFDQLSVEQLRGIWYGLDKDLIASIQEEM